MQVLSTDDLCAGEQVFFAATGVSDGDRLTGGRYFAGGATSNSIVMRSGSGTGSLAHSLAVYSASLASCTAVQSPCLCCHLMDTSQDCTVMVEKHVHSELVGRYADWQARHPTT